MALSPVRIPDNIVKLYQDPQRHYHTLDHINHMLSLIPTDHPNARELIYATWFHDCVYGPQAKHGVNETESIQQWEKYVEEQKEELYDVFRNETNILLVQRFLDMDMDILASQRNDYLEYTRKLRQEYAYFSDKAFRKGRAEFLRGELKKNRVFYLDENHGKNKIARENMRAELAMLEECL
ncbi:hypothetical protein SLS60_009127 [Paraconiothyrium brasiliense]|uniref:HD domain-containing protein n=1 Tax=Paraconiothyrium brasiliense TaxID=300254 RepID=A0ABR3QWD3_9PLEO